ncbi:phosphotransferase [bacterium]|nr:phosphotransferase [bacterium]
MTDFTIDLTVFQLLNIYKKRKVLDFFAEPLFGDASGRAYYRVTFEGETAVMMKVADVKPGEFGRGDSFNDFIAIDNFLRDNGIKVPKIYAVIPELKAMLLEDLGDTTLFKMIEDDRKNKVHYVKEAVGLLADTQTKIYSRTDFNTPADKRKFGKALFMEEFYHFYEYMIAKRVYDVPYTNLWPKLEKHFTRISNELARLPYCFSHRDFQSKNIMQKDGEFYLIDFQDALMAPIVYDAVSLLRDSYIELKPDELDSLLRHLWSIDRPMHEFFNDYEEFEHAFYLQTLQRKMKDAGRFVYLNQVKNKEWFVPFILPTLGYVRDALAKLEENKILDLLAPFIPEFRAGRREN